MNSKVRICPKCRGLYDAPNSQKYAVPCPVCKGVGQVHTGHSCVCGRPGYKEVGTKLSCGRKACADKILGVQKHHDPYDYSNCSGICL